MKMSKKSSNLSNPYESFTAEQVLKIQDSSEILTFENSDYMQTDL